MCSTESSIYHVTVIGGLRYHFQEGPATSSTTIGSNFSCDTRYPGADSKSKSKSKKTLFNVGQCKQYNISSHLEWVLVADKSMHMIIYNKIHIK